MFNLDLLKKLTKEKNMLVEQVLNECVTITPQGFYAGVRNDTLRFNVVAAIAKYFGVPIDDFYISEGGILISEPSARYLSDGPKTDKEAAGHYRALYEKCQAEMIKALTLLNKHGIKLEN